MAEVAEVAEGEREAKAEEQQPPQHAINVDVNPPPTCLPTSRRCGSSRASRSSLPPTTTTTTLDDVTTGQMIASARLGAFLASRSS